MCGVLCRRSCAPQQTPKVSTVAVSATTSSASPLLAAAVSRACGWEYFSSGTRSITMCGDAKKQWAEILEGEFHVPSRHSPAIETFRDDEYGHEEEYLTSMLSAVMSLRDSNVTVLLVCASEEDAALHILEYAETTL